MNNNRNTSLLWMNEGETFIIYLLIICKYRKLSVPKKLLYDLLGIKSPPLIDLCCHCIRYCYEGLLQNSASYFVCENSVVIQNLSRDHCALEV